MTEPAKYSEPRERLLQTASRLFYAEGIHSVGIDRIVSEAGVTRATLYRHFAGKEELVLAYLHAEDSGIRGYFAAADAPDATPEDILRAVVWGIADDVASRHTRGCPFINAAAEYPEADSPVRALVADHRAWFKGTLAAIAEAAKIERPDRAAGALVLLRDAALVGGYLDGMESIRESFLHGASAVTGRDFEGTV